MIYMKKFIECKSYSEMARLLGYNYYNGRVKKEIINFCERNNLDAEIIISNNNKPNKCLNCGEEIKGKNRFTKKFCNSSCAASFNNKRRTHNEETKEKIRLALTHEPNLDKLILNGDILNPLNIEYTNRYIPWLKYKPKKCVICGNEFKPYITKSGMVSNSKTCSKKCQYELKSDSCKKAMNRVMNEGRHQGWKSRNIISYPEDFWMNVLSNNNIKYIHNFPFGKYFLDFYIEIDGRKIDLEIDGKQHKYDERRNSDIIRDEFVKTQGVEVYRIEWNSINTEYGKNLMKEKIENFLEFIK